MKRVMFLLVLAGLATSVHAQYSARQLTRKVVPQQPAQPTRPGAPVGQAPGVAVPAATVPQKTEAQKAEADKKLVAYYKARAEKGSESALFELAMRYLAGKGVEKNEKLGMEWLEKAAKNGSTAAGKKLAELKPAVKTTEEVAEKTK